MPNFLFVFFELCQISAKKFLPFVNSYPYFCLFQIPCKRYHTINRPIQLLNFMRFIVNPV